MYLITNYKFMNFKNILFVK